MIRIEYDKTNRLVKKIMDITKVYEFAIYRSESFKFFKYYNCYYDGNHTVITVFGINFYWFY